MTRFHICMPLPGGIDKYNFLFLLFGFALFLVSCGQEPSGTNAADHIAAATKSTIDSEPFSNQEIVNPTIDTSGAVVPADRKLSNNQRSDTIDARKPNIRSEENKSFQTMHKPAEVKYDVKMVTPSQQDLQNEFEQDVTTELSGDDVVPVLPIVQEDENTVYSFVQEMPMFPGGESAMLTFLSTNIRYPELELENNIEGKVFVKLIVEKDGEISNAEIARGIKGGPGLGREALRVVNLFPKFSPGMMNGQPVRTSMTIPIAFYIK